VWSVIVHGGAGVIDPAMEQPHRAGCLAAVEAARPILDRGGDALDACCAAVRALEDNPVFNAGIGAVLDRAGMPVCDALVMRGSDLALGAVACVLGVRHPVDLARAVLDDGRHCLLVGPGAIDFARTAKVELWDPDRMITDRSRTSWEKSPLIGMGPPAPIPRQSSGDTVGAVARDQLGRLAVAISTGGTYLRLPGRVGDSPLAGAGAYARDDLGGLAATGHGETMMRTVFAYSALMGLRADPAGLRSALDAATAVAGGKGGAIAILPDGSVVFARNTAHMGVAWQRQGAPAESAF
jgi:L-asparaginase / beta-aspartyl-peptidase